MSLVFSNKNNSLLNRDPSSALDLVRKIVQKDLNEKIRLLFQEYIRQYFGPAVRNVETNCGIIESDLLEQTCVNALEHAKAVFRPGDPTKAPLKRKIPCRDQSLPHKRSLPSVAKHVKREGPKWDPDRLRPDTIFILGSRANKALGYGMTRGRLYLKHPELFKYPGDQHDKEWLAKNQIMSTTGGKAYLMILSDVVELSNSLEYSSRQNLRPSEFVGFTLPEFILEKIKAFMRISRTNSATNSSSQVTHELLPNEEWMGKSEPSAVNKEEPSATVVSSKERIIEPRPQAPHDLVAASEVQDILNEIKEETVGEGNEGGTTDDDDLGFLHGMNLTSLVREFEMEAGAGSQHLGLLSLADDTESFSELSNGVQENIESLDNIEFH